MEFWTDLSEAVVQNWIVWFISAVLVVAAVIDGLQLKVPNWLTFPLVLGGWGYSLAFFGFEGLAWSLVGAGVGLALLLPAYSIGGMGAGDVKLLAGVGAWIYATDTLGAFAVSALVGGILAVTMVLYSGRWRNHLASFRVIAAEIMMIRDPERLAALAAERKGSMLLLPYGIPIMIGTITYFAWNGMFI